MLESRRRKRCQVCNELFKPFNTLQVVCGFPKQCSEKFAKMPDQVKAQRVKMEQDTAKENRAIRKKFRQNDRSWHLQKTQAEFNKWIRLRDRRMGCVSCGKKNVPQFHAGHYLSVGSHPELRFSKLNCHGQCSTCNSFKSGSIVTYRIELIERIGIELVEWLEGPHKITRYTIDDLKVMRKQYRDMNKKMEIEIC